MLVKAAIAVVAAAGATTGVVVAVSAGAPSAEQAVVTNLVDGDTLDVSIDGRTERVRMLNIDTPEVTGPEVQCLGLEASAHLASLLPVGTPVTLEYDVERTDGYDRTLAGVHTADGVLINAEMARAGLAVPVVIGENDRFYPPVLEARDEAAAQHRGLFSTDVTCTLPAQVAAVSAAVEEGPAAAAQATGASIAELESSATAAAVALAAARALEDAFVRNPVGHVWEVFTSDERSRLLQDLRSSRATAERESAALGDAAAKAREEAARLAEEQRQARAAEEQRQARAAEEQRQAEERQQAREAERQREREREQERERDAASRRDAPAEPESSAGGDPYPGYTGPRCYAPGGKTWKPC